MAHVNKLSDADGGPVYRRIQRHFLERISSGDLALGERLPTEMAIAKSFGTSRATVQSAMAQLVHDGWIEKQPGRGTFVSDSPRSARIDLDAVRSFEEDVSSHGDRVTYRMLSVERVPAPAHAAECLRVEAGTPLFRLERLRLVGAAVIGMERRFFAPHIALDVPLARLDALSIHEIVRQCLRLQIGRMDVAISACAADPATASKLEVAPASPLLLRRHTMFSTAGDVILYGESCYCEPFSFRYVARTREHGMRSAP